MSVEYAGALVFLLENVIVLVILLMSVVYAGERPDHPALAVAVVVVILAKLKMLAAFAAVLWLLALLPILAAEILAFVLLVGAHVAGVHQHVPRLAPALNLTGAEMPRIVLSLL